MSLKKRMLSMLLAGALVSTGLFGGMDFKAAASESAQGQQEYARAQETGRKILNFNSGWGFFRGSLEGAEAMDFDDSAFANVTIPHTMRLEKKHCDGSNSTYKGIGWYRRYFTLGEEYRGKKINIDFEGVMMDSEVYLNGELLYERNGGYVGFSVDISDKIRFGETNVLAVKVSNEDNPDTPPGRPENNLDFHYYGGIYRDVTMRITDTLYISDALWAEEPASGGVFVTYPEVTKEKAVVQVKTHVVNDLDETVSYTVKQTLKDAEGKRVADTLSQSDTLEAESAVSVSQQIEVLNPKLWHPDTPYLYTLETAVYRGEELADMVTTQVGVRTITYKPDGFYINGERLYLRGANRHQAFQNVGDAAPDSMQYRDALLLKEGGFNAVRAAHYPQDPAFLKACDEIGLLVVECQPGWQNFTNSQTFYDRTIRDVREMIRRDRNHPCVILWETSLNETGIPGQYAGWYEEAVNAAHEEYPGNQFFTANDYGFRGDLYDVCYKVQDTQWSQNPADWKDFDPQKPFFTREWGDYEGSSKALRRQGTAAMNTQILTRQKYLNGDGYSDWGGLDASERIGGYFLWSFNDYSRGSNSQTLGSGVVDIDRYEKNGFYWLKSMQSAKDPAFGPTVFISDDYTEDSGNDIMVFSNCDSVKLYQNTKTVGEINRSEALQSVPHIAEKGGSPIFTFHLDSFEEGSLMAEGILDGKAVVTHEVRTPQRAVRLEVEIRENGIRPVADGSDLIPVYIKAVDSNGTIVPDYDKKVRITVSGEGELVGKEIPRIRVEEQTLENGIGFGFVRTTGKSGTICVNAVSEGIEAGMAETESISFNGAFVPGAGQTEWVGGVEKLEEEQVKNLASGKKVTASSAQAENGNNAENAVDDDEGTRWCASGGSLPQWLMVDLGTRQAAGGFQILWENSKSVYQYIIEASDDGVNWKTVVDMSENTTVNGSRDIQNAQAIGRYFRLSVNGISDGWASLYEFIVLEDEKLPEVDPGDTIPDEMISSITATGGEVAGRGTDKLRDGETVIGTGWLSQSKEFPQSVTVAFSGPQTLLGNRIYWEKDSSWYTYSLEVSQDGEAWETAIDNVTVGGQHYKAETYSKAYENISFARVTIHNITAGGDYQIGMAEWILYGVPTQKSPMKEFDYVSDIDWESAQSDYGSVKKDDAVYGGGQILHSEYGDLPFAKGIGTDTNSEVIYDVTNKDYTEFTAYIGINAKAGKHGGEAVFRVYKDDELAYESGVKMRDDNCDFIRVDIAGAKKIKLETVWHENPENAEARYNTHTNWSDARFYYGSSERVSLRILCDREALLQRDGESYTLRSYRAYQDAVAAALEMLMDEEVSDRQLKESRTAVEDSILNLTPLSELTSQELLKEMTERAAEIRKQAEEEKKAAEQARLNAEKAQKEAEQARLDAKKAQQEAEQAKLDAERAQQEAGQDKTAAEQAQKAAEQAKLEAEKMKEKAEQAKLNAEKAQQEAEQAKANAEQAQQEAERAQNAAEQAKSEAEQARQEAERAKLEAERAKAEAEKAQREAEAAREEAKKAQEIAADKSKAAAESARQAAEAKAAAEQLQEQAKLAGKAAQQAAAKAEFVSQQSEIRKLSAGKKQLKVTAEKVKGADGYEVQYSLKSNFKKSQKKVSKKPAITIKKLKAGKKYYVRVRAYKVINGSKIYIGYSTKKGKKIK